MSKYKVGDKLIAKEWNGSINSDEIIKIETVGFDTHLNQTVYSVLLRNTLHGRTELQLDRWFKPFRKKMSFNKWFETYCQK
jgi:hypothetical protein